MKRTHLPLNALRVFDAAARHLSFTRAADELAVTPAAVGQQIRALEDLLGVVLFRRTSKGLELTDEATAGLEPLRSGFLSFEDAVQAMQAGQSSFVYTIAAPRDFFAAWLAPRLAEFRAEFCLPFTIFYEKHTPHVPLPQLEIWFHSRFREAQDSVVELPHAREFLEFCRARGLRLFLLSTVHRDHFAAQTASNRFHDFLEKPYIEILDKRTGVSPLWIPPWPST